MTSSPVANSFRYHAFISYRHVDPDRRWAKWLHAALETYRVPKALVAQGFPSRLSRVFRDEEELPANADLSREITTALEQSRFLIVVCSPRTPRSRWVNAEIEYFRALGRHDRILALLIEGEPQESFPTALTEIRRSIIERGTDGTPLRRERIEQVEPLAADVRPVRTDEKSHVLRGHALLRLMACILGCAFDDLRRRDAERRARRARILLAGLGALTISMSALAAFSLIQWERAKQGEAAARDEKQAALFSANEARRQASLARASEARAEVRRAEAEAARMEEAAQRVRATHRAILATAASLAERQPGLAASILAELPDDLSDPHRALEVAYQVLPYTPSHVRLPLNDSSSDLLIAPDGSRVVAICFGSVQIVDPTGLTPPRVIPADDILKIGALSSDARLLAAGGSLGGAFVWNTDSGELLHTFTNHENEITALEFMPDNAGLLTASLDGTIRLHRFDQQRHTVLRFERPVLDATLAHDGRSLLCLIGDRDPNWSIQTFHALRRSGEALLLRSDDAGALWDLQGNYSQKTLRADPTPARWIGRDAHDLCLVTHASGLSWKFDSEGRSGSVVARSPGAPAFVSLSPDRAWLLQDSGGGGAEIVPLINSEPAPPLRWARNQTVDQIWARFCGRNSVVLTQTVGLVQLWERAGPHFAGAGTLEPWIPVCTLGPLLRAVTSTQAAAHAPVVAAITMDEALEIWTLPSRAPLADATGRSITTDWRGDTILGGVLDVQPRYAEPGSGVTVLRQRRADPEFMRLFLQTGLPERAIIHARENPLRGSDFTGRNRGFLTLDGLAIATGWSGGGAIWNTRNGAVSAFLGPQEQRDILDLAFAPATRSIAIASETGTAIAKLEGTLAPTWISVDGTQHSLAVAISPDGRTLADLTREPLPPGNRLRIWSTDPTRLIATHEARAFGAGASIEFLRGAPNRLVIAGSRSAVVAEVRDTSIEFLWEHTRRADVESFRSHPTLPLAAVGYEDGTVLRIDATTPAVQWREWRGNAEVKSIEFAPDGSRLAAVLESGAILLAHVGAKPDEPPPRPLLFSGGIMDAVTHAAFSADGGRLMIFGMGGGMTSFAIDWPNRRRELRAAVGPGLSPSERLEHLGELAPADPQTPPLTTPSAVPRPSVSPAPPPA